MTAVGTPSGFAELASSRPVLVDVYLGGRKVAESLVIAEPGRLSFRAPGELVSKLADVKMTPELLAALSGKLATNSSLACSQSNANQCGVLEPETLGIIYDEDRFRVDLFINPKYLRTRATNLTGYLPKPDGALAIVDTIGLDASGAIGGESLYNIQNRAIIGLGEGRIRSNLSIASHLGLVVDDLVGEVDHKDLRYSAGLFWAPGDDFVGQRRIVGAGIGTQFDTWADPEALRSTPLVLFLSEPARVEFVVDGRLLGSRSYPGGNIELDTSALPEGSYPLLIRVRHSNGTVEEQRRFFVKNLQVPPADHPIFYAYAGLLANTRSNQPISVSRIAYYQAGLAQRITNSLAFELALLGTQRKAIVEGGGWLVTGTARVRAAALVSSAADWGALVQASIGGHGPLSISLDARRIWSRDGNPLVPLPSYASSFDMTPPAGVQLATGSYTQLTGSIGMRLGNGFVSVVGSYRKDRSARADYAIGPSINLPLVSRNRFQIAFDASAQRTRSSSAAFIGLRAFLSSGHLSALGSVGHAFESERGGGEPARSRLVGNLDAQISEETQGQALINAEVGAARDAVSSSVHAGTIIDSSLGHLRADVLHDVEGGRTTQYDVAVQSGFALRGNAAVWGSRELEPSAIVIALSGDAQAALFNVLVDGVPRGQVRVGRRLSLFVPAYRTYKIRLVPTASASVDYDSAEREVTLYPGNVRLLSWRANAFFTLFAQAVSPAGHPVSNALVETLKGVADTDSNGYFQVDMHRDDPIMIRSDTLGSCRVKLGDVAVRDDFASAGKVVCQ